MTDPPLPLHVETRGLEPAAGVDTFLLLHGYGASMFSWRPWVPGLAELGHVVMVDLKGFGSAPKPDDGAYGARDQAALVHRLIVERDLANVTLIGHSFGGAVALLLALRDLDEGAARVRRLVLVASAAYPQRLPPFVTLARFPRLSLLGMRILGPVRLIRFVLASIVYDRWGIDEHQVRGYAAPLEEMDARRALLDAALQIVPTGVGTVVQRYPQIQVPTLLMWGAHDRVIPLWVGRRLAGDLPNARLCVFERCGHLPVEEVPQESWAALRGFLRSDADADGSRETVAQTRQ